jgi:hypothetical protein
MKSSTVYFVHIGEFLPQYALASLSLCREFSGLSPHLIASNSALKRLPRGLAETTPIEDFYDNSLFRNTRTQVLAPHNFREEFWLRSFERLFVLDQFQSSSGKFSLFHAELDQLLFRADLLLENMEKGDLPGLSLPFHNAQSALASVMYVQGRRALPDLLNFAAETEPFMNEMQLLARWAVLNPDQFKAFPTLASVMSPQYLKEIFPSSTLKPGQIGGLTDAAQLGQWIGGVDGRNLSLGERPRNHFVDPPTRMMLTKDQLEAIRFRIDFGSGYLTVALEGGEVFKVFNLHLHSKIHKWIASKPYNLRRLIDLANLPSDSSVPSARTSQVFHKTSTAIQAALNSPDRTASFITSELNKLFGFRRSSAPYLSGDTFRGLTKNVWDSQRQSIDPEKLQESRLIFLEPELLDSFSNQVLNKLKSPVTLILGNSDINHGAELALLTQNPLVKKVFAQNLREELPGAEILPIGLENRWLARNGELFLFKKNKGASIDRKSRIMWCFSAHTNPKERGDATRELNMCSTADNLGELSPSAHQKALKGYAFVASPPGNGLDTHRTWEAMYQGCVPVLLRCYLSDSYSNLGLPVWVVDSYGELANLSEEQLKEKYLQLQPRFSSEALWFDFWKNRIMNISG